MAAAVVATPPVDLEAGESTPLLLNDPTTAAVDNDEPAPLQDIKAESLKERTVSAVAAVNFFLSVLTLMFQAALHPVVWISGFLGLLISPLAAMQQHKLTQVEALAQTNERLQMEVDDLATQNTRLSVNLQEMEESVHNLEAMEQTLATLQVVQGQSMDELEEQLEESRGILATMDKNYKGQLLQNLITVLLGADQDGNMILSDEDIEDIIRRLEGLHNVNINDAKLRQMIIDNGRSVEAVMEVAKAALMAGDSAEEGDDALFTFLQEEEQEA
eukprot:CAMPEP_0168734978 /NCGR_PEP_ID=MMETSP0724-20121128/9095_1 /TAXON_ID=265536 /ORGANISM="Amphiprora sp., Strain CCMP467" /LENGTH=272 /DNA_ID=CAMNT_0008782105 /DNA_START=60 /DNA_END=878 /DNA_ORIENTATION=-